MRLQQHPQIRPPAARLNCAAAVDRLTARDRPRSSAEMASQINLMGLLAALVVAFVLLLGQGSAVDAAVEGRMLHGRDHGHFSHLNGTRNGTKFNETAHKHTIHNHTVGFNHTVGHNHTRNSNCTTGNKTLNGTHGGGRRAGFFGRFRGH
eukprot:SM000070S21316  [mRNA]  locus=s70:196259:197558:- [translate_table: standard]